ncbi:MAG: ABC transporter permease [Myxococcales bacterium]|nr:ABC transporter permease [Myxococcales bacterium]
MIVFDTVKTAWRSLVSNGMRTALTGLGMIIGVAAVVSVLAVGEGARSQVEGRIRSMGANLITVRPESAQGPGGARIGSVQTLKLGDVTALSTLPGVSAVAGEIGGSAQIRYREKNLTAQVSGITPEYLAVRALSIGEGLPFTASDLRERQRVVIIGANIASQLFPTESALGQRIQIKGIAFRVQGVIAAKGDSGFSSPDDLVLVPISVHQGILFGQDFLSNISLQVADERDMASVQAGMREILRLRHDLHGDEADDFQLRSQAEILETLGAITGTFTALLGAVAMVSLLVGGIGIMNIMLVSVRERTREIGVRMAVGARRSDILLQFLVESVLVALAGGLLGLALGYGGAVAIARVGGWETIVPTYAVALALGVSVTVGLVFGVGPARRAAKLDPVEALRQE